MSYNTGYRTNLRQNNWSDDDVRFSTQNQSLSQRAYFGGMPFIDYYRRGRLIWTANYASMRDAKPSLRPSLLSATITPMALIALSCANDEGNVRRVLPERG